MPSPEVGWLLRNVEVAGRRLDCRIRGQHIAELRPGLDAHPGERLLDGKGGALIPGLADHHIHLRADAAARASLDLAGADLAGADLAGMSDDGGARLRELIGPSGPPDMSALSRDLASWGVTHLAEATPNVDALELAKAFPQHVLTMGPDGVGPLKVVIADHEYPHFDDLVDRVRQAHAAGPAVAVHAVTQTALAMAIAAFSIAGTNALDRIEHAAICDDDAAHRLTDLGIAVVTQPSLVARHGREYFDDSEIAERHTCSGDAGALSGRASGSP